MNGIRIPGEAGIRIWVANSNRCWKQDSEEAAEDACPQVERLRAVGNCEDARGTSAHSMKPDAGKSDTEDTQHEASRLLQTCDKKVIHYFSVGTESVSACPLMGDPASRQDDGLLRWQ